MDTNNFEEILTGDTTNTRGSGKDAYKNSTQKLITISDPILKKELIQTSTFYILTIKDKVSPFPRKFSDFFALRKKYVEKWPGIYIPNVPHKRTIETIVTNAANNLIKQTSDQKLIGYRMRVLQDFFYKCWVTSYLRDSPETEVFLSNSKDYEKVIFY